MTISGFARLDRSMICGHLDQRRDEVGGEERSFAAGKRARHLLGDALDARAAGDERVGRPARGALSRRRQREAAVMAVEPVAVAVLDQPCRALRTVEAVAAGAAERERRVAAAVENSSACWPWPSVSSMALTSVGESQRPASGGSLRMSIGDGGKLRAGVAAGQREAAVAPGAGVDVAFERRRRRGQHDGELAEAARATAMSRAW